MIKRLCLLLLGIISLGLINFSNASYDLELLTGGKLTTVPNTNTVNVIYKAPYGIQYVGNLYCFSGTINSGSVEFFVGFGQNQSLNLYRPPNKSSMFVSMGTCTINGCSNNHYFGCFPLVQYTVYNMLLNSRDGATTYDNIDLDYQIYQLKTSSGGCPTINQEYCVNNNLCPACDYSSYESQIESLSGDLSSCQSDYSNLQDDYSILSGNYSSCEGELNTCMANSGNNNSGGNRSSLFINDIQHLGAGIINITIPDEISWDYTNEDDVFDLNVVGYNVDSDYIS